MHSDGLVGGTLIETSWLEDATNWRDKMSHQDKMSHAVDNSTRHRFYAYLLFVGGTYALRNRSSNGLALEVLCIRKH